MVISDVLLSELIAVVTRPKFSRYFSQNDVNELIVLILARSEQVEPKVKIELCRDPKDNFLLDLAATARADCLVTGDKDFLDDRVLKESMQNARNVWCQSCQRDGISSNDLIAFESCKSIITKIVRAHCQALPLKLLG